MIGAIGSLFRHEVPEQCDILHLSLDIPLQPRQIDEH
jgi:hypothetical protein